MSDADIQQKLKEFISREIMHGQGNDLTSSTPLLELGIIDSLSMVALLAYIEEQYALKLSEDQLIPENFSTIEALAGLVHRSTAHA